ncbi:MAG: hypothetical protein JRL30_20305 [Deltaproteobacteria bacterium]|nr:hypothetical protein [Deltaproteobacteria bacterium]
MSDNRPFYDEDMEMCRKCGYIECSPKYCTRVTHLIRVGDYKEYLEEIGIVTVDIDKIQEERKAKEKAEEQKSKDELAEALKGSEYESMMCPHCNAIGPCQCNDEEMEEEEIEWEDE